MKPEEEVLQKLKHVLSVGNDSQAIRIIEQYGFFKEEQSKQFFFTRCCCKLKDKEVMTFEEWVKSEGYTKIKGKDEYRKGMIRSDDFNLRQQYVKYLNL